MLWILILAGCVALAYYYLKNVFYYWTNLGVNQFPMSKTLSAIFKSLFQTEPLPVSVEKLYNGFPNERYFGIYNIVYPGLILKDPELLKDILVKDFNHFTDHIRFVPEGVEPLWEKNLFALLGDKWRKMRATLSPSFTSSKMKTMFTTVSQCAQQFTDYFAEKNEPLLKLEMKDAFTRLANDVIASSAFGVTCDSMRNPDNDFYLMGREITNFSGFNKSATFICLMAFPKLAKLLGLRLFKKETADYFTNIVKKNIEYREKKGIVRSDMIQLLLEAKNHQQVVDGVETQKLTDMDIAAQALVFFFAGFESVANEMCFMAHELAINVDVQEKLIDEIDETYEACQGQITYEALFKMKYLDMVVNETLRKWPVPVAGERVCVKPYTIQPVRPGERPVEIKVGLPVMLPFFGIHRDPKYYPNPSQFDPERFNEENKKKIDPYTFLTFGIGPRGCIGNRFALMEIKLAFFHLLKKFEITVIEKTSVPIKLQKSQVQMGSADGFWLGLKAR